MGNSAKTNWEEKNDEKYQKIKVYNHDVGGVSGLGYPILSNSGIRKRSAKIAIPAENVVNAPK